MRITLGPVPPFLYNHLHDEIELARELVIIDLDQKTGPRNGDGTGQFRLVAAGPHIAIVEFLKRCEVSVTPLSSIILRFMVTTSGNTEAV